VTIPPQPNSDIVALGAQADIHRLFEQVVFPSLGRLDAPAMAAAGLDETWNPAGPDAVVVLGEPWPPPMAQSVMLTQVREALTEETRRGFALVLGATFERQIRTWLIGKDASQALAIADENLRALTNRIRDQLRVDLRSIERLTDDLYELWELVSASRHGDGDAARRLADSAPHLWPPERLEAARSADIRVRAQDLDRYYRAVLTAWGQLGATPFPPQRPDPTDAGAA